MTIVPPPEDLSLPREHVEAGFRRVMAGVDAGPDTEDLLEAWQLAIRSGDPRVERDTLLLHLGNHGWRWPELDAAAASFAGGPWPLCWDGLIGHPYVWDQINPFAKLKLLQGDLHLAATASKVLEDLNDPFVARVYRIGLWGGHTACPVESRLSESKRVSADHTGLGTWLPPLFPGSSVTLRAVSRRREA